MIRIRESSPPGPDPSHTYRQSAVSPGTGPANAEHGDDQLLWLRYASIWCLSFSRPVVAERKFGTI